MCTVQSCKRMSNTPVIPVFKMARAISLIFDNSSIILLLQYFGVFVLFIELHNTLKKTSVNRDSILRTRRKSLSLKLYQKTTKCLDKHKYNSPSVDERQTQTVSNRA